MAIMVAQSEQQSTGSTPNDLVAEAAKTAAQVMGFRSESGRELIRDIVAAAAPILREPPGIYGEVKAERQRAHDKHGETSMEGLPVTDMTRLSVLVEEVGEVAREFNEARHRTHTDLLPQGERESAVDLVRLRRELIQTAAMAAAWADALGSSHPKCVECAVPLDIAPDDTGLCVPCFDAAFADGG